MQILAEYEIRGHELWYNNVEYEWIENGDDLFGGHLNPISSEWERETDFEGAIRFYDEEADYLALFWEGEMIRIKQLQRD
jgi:hypothetical protein